jgi:hypothetical protein
VTEGPDIEWEPGGIERWSGAANGRKERDRVKALKAVPGRSAVFPGDQK